MQPHGLTLCLHTRESRVKGVGRWGGGEREINISTDSNTPPVITEHNANTQIRTLGDSITLH